MSASMEHIEEFARQAERRADAKAALIEAEKPAHCSLTWVRETAMSFDKSSETPTDHGMTVEQMEAFGKRAEAIKLATQRLRDAEQRLEFLKRHTEARKKDWEVNQSWEPSLILQKGTNWNKDITIKVRITYAHVEQQLVDDIKRAKRELILLGGRP